MSGKVHDLTRPVGSSETTAQSKRTGPDKNGHIAEQPQATLLSSQPAFFPAFFPAFQSATRPFCAASFLLGYFPASSFKYAALSVFFFFAVSSSVG